MRVDLSASNPYRPGDWRWQRAGLIANGDLRSIGRFDDQFVKRAVRMARVLTSGDEHDDVQMLAFRDPDFYWSYRVYQGQREMQAVRAELEARILADDTSENIERRCGIRPTSLELYKKLFFDVSDRLDRSTYILHVIIGTALYRGFSERDINILWKFYGYTYGVKVLEALVAQAIDPDRALSADAVAGVLQDDHRNSLLRKSVIAARTIKVSDFNALQLLDVANKAKEVDKAGGGEGGGAGMSQANAANLQRVLGTIKLAIGDYAEDSVDTTAIKRYDQSSSELTSQQLLAAARNELPESLCTPPSLKYPEPNHAQQEQGSSEKANPAGS